MGEEVWYDSLSSEIIQSSCNHIEFRKEQKSNAYLS